MAGEEAKGLARAKKIYQDPYYRAKQLKAEGKKVIGYLSIYPPLEMMTALDIVPCRLFGNIREPITKADFCFPTMVCPSLRSTLDLGLKGKYDFLDGVVMAHPCEVGEKLTYIWRTYLTPAYSFYIDTPHTTHQAALEYHRQLLGDFKKSLESFTGKELSTKKIKQAIEVHNQQRASVRELYELRKLDPPLISGVETLQVMKALTVVSADEGNELLREVISEVKQRKDGSKKRTRLLIWGSEIDDIAIVGVIEESGANVVMDNNTVGSVPFFHDVEMTADPLDGLARHYLVDLKFPRTFVEAVFGEAKKDYTADLEVRFGYLGRYAKEWNVKGVILYVLRYCDIFGYEVPQIRDYFAILGLPTLYLEHDYSEAALSPLRTRVQAFLEVLR